MPPPQVEQGFQILGDIIYMRIVLFFVLIVLIDHILFGENRKGKPLLERLISNLTLQCILATIFLMLYRLLKSYNPPFLGK